MEIKFENYDSLEDLSRLKDSPYQRNKHTDAQIERLAKIMKEDGVRQPIHLVKGTDRIVFGHGRKEAALRNGWEKFPVVYQAVESKDQEYRIVQSDNAIAKWADLDFSQINLDFDDPDLNLGPFDIDLLGIEDFDVTPQLKEHDLEDKEKKDSKPQYILEVQFPNEDDMKDTQEELLEKGYLVKVK